MPVLQIQWDDEVEFKCHMLVTLEPTVYALLSESNCFASLSNGANDYQDGHFEAKNPDILINSSGMSHNTLEASSTIHSPAYYS